MADVASRRFTLGALAEQHGCERVGDAALPITGVCALEPGLPGCLSFCADPALRPALAQSRASAVVLSARDAAHWAGPALITREPAVVFARIAAGFDRADDFEPGIDPRASLAADATLGAGCHVGPGAVIEAGAVLGEGCYVGPNCIIGRDARLGTGCRLEAQVWIGPRTQIGARARVLPGAVIGARGFGLARAATGWIEVPQLGRVVIGDDVEVGANTTIDRGALTDTVIGDGVKLDNQIQIAHNCDIGAGTAIAACVGIAGSTRVGRNCMIGGAAGIGGHLEICDNVVVLGLAMVTKSITRPGVYGSGQPAQPAREWRREVARVRRLPRIEERLAAIEQQLGVSEPTGETEDEQGNP